MHRRDAAPNPSVQRIIIGELRRRGFMQRIDNLRELRMFHQRHAQMNALAQPFQVERIAEIVVVKRRLRIRIGGCDAQLARGQRQVDAHAHNQQALFGVEAHNLNHIVAQMGCFGGVAQRHLLSAHAFRGNGKIGLAAPARMHGGMIAQVLAHARQIQARGYAHPPQIVRRAYAGQHKQMRRSHRPGAQHHFIRLCAKEFAAALHFHAHGAAAARSRRIIGEQDAARGAVGLDGEVEAVARRIDVAQRRAPADAVGIVQRIGADAGGVRVIVVRIGGKAGGDAGVVEGELVGQQAFNRVPLRQNGAVAAVKIVLKIQIRL